MLPLAVLGGCAAGLAVMFLELALEGDEPGSAARLARPLLVFAAGYCGVLLGGKVAPCAKVKAAIGLSSAYLLVLAGLGFREGSGLWLRPEVLAAGATGAVAACLRLRWTLAHAPVESADAGQEAPGDRGR